MGPGLRTWFIGLLSLRPPRLKRRAPTLSIRSEINWNLILIIRQLFVRDLGRQIGSDPNFQFPEERGPNEYRPDRAMEANHHLQQQNGTRLYPLL